MSVPRRWIASPPSRWADSEREFHLAYLEDPTPFPRQPVTVSWKADRADTPPTHPIAWIFWAISKAVRALWTRYRTGAWPLPRFEVHGLSVTLDDRSRRMGVPIDSSTAPLERDGTRDAVLVGGFGSNSISCIEMDGRTYWPNGHPVEVDVPL